MVLNNHTALLFVIAYYTACLDPDDVFFSAVQALENPGLNDRLEQKTWKNTLREVKHMNWPRTLLFLIELQHENDNSNIFDTYKCFKKERRRK